MATIKNYTDLEQSRKLAEILPIESADMWWVALNWQETEYYVEVKQDGINQPKKAVPCWSLTALLSVLSCNLKIAIAINDNCQSSTIKHKYAIGAVDNNNYDCFADNLVDACVAMIEKLDELNLL